MLKSQRKYANISFLCNHLVLYLTTSVSNNLDYLQFFFLRERMVASLEYSKIQNVICNNSLTNRIMTDTYNIVHM